MTLVKIIIFIASVIGIIAIVRYWIMDLGFPGSFVEAMKQYSCPVCGKKYWTSYSSSKCHKDSPEREAIRRAARRKLQEYNSKTPPRSYRVRERDCPRCNGQPGNYSCPMCEGRGKTFM